MKQNSHKSPRSANVRRANRLDCYPRLYEHFAQFFELSLWSSRRPVCL